MSFQIDKPGFYRQRNGGKAEVFAERDGWWYGRQLDDDGVSIPLSWTDTGCALHGINAPDDITGPWHEPPTPPDGYELQGRDYVAKRGDKVWADGWWAGVAVCIGHTVESYGDLFPHERPHYIASPIPKPYIGPLPEPEKQWTPTCELRWELQGHVERLPNDAVQSARWPTQLRLMQKWTCGSETEWRPVGVEQ